MQNFDLENESEEKLIMMGKIKNECENIYKFKWRGAGAGAPCTVAVVS